MDTQRIGNVEGFTLNADGFQFADLLQDRVGIQHICVVVALVAAKGAEGALGCADIRVIDIAIEY